MYFHYLEKADPEIASIIKKEMGRQENKIELIASENFVSPAVMEAMSLPNTRRINMRKVIPASVITEDVNL